MNKGYNVEWHKGRYFMERIQGISQKMFDIPNDNQKPIALERAKMMIEKLGFTTKMVIHHHDDEQVAVWIIAQDRRG